MLTMKNIMYATLIMLSAGLFVTAQAQEVGTKDSGTVLQNTDSMNTLNTLSAMQTSKITKEVAAIKAKNDAIINCGKQRKFYNESTKACQ